MGATIPSNIRERGVQYYQTASGACPFRVWRSGIRDSAVKAAVDTRIARFRLGNFGDSRPIGKGVSESVIDVGPGYRIFYRIHGDVVILLNGGDKSNQSAAIKRAISFWSDYKERTS
jgi:putative addiction module killer protein